MKGKVVQSAQKHTYQNFEGSQTIISDRWR